jgi:hypothetical protein
MYECSPDEAKRNPGQTCNWKCCSRIALRFMRASVTGLDKSIPFCVIHSPGTCFCTGSAQGRHLMGFAEDRSANLQVRGRCHIPHGGLT